MFSFSPFSTPVHTRQRETGIGAKRRRIYRRRTRPRTRNSKLVTKTSHANHSMSPLPAPLLSLLFCCLSRCCLSCCCCCCWSCAPASRASCGTCTAGLMSRPMALRWPHTSSLVPLQSSSTMGTLPSPCPHCRSWRSTASGPSVRRIFGVHRAAAEPADV